MPLSCRQQPSALQGWLAGTHVGRCTFWQVHILTSAHLGMCMQPGVQVGAPKCSAYNSQGLNEPGWWRLDQKHSVMQKQCESSYDILSRELQELYKRGQVQKLDQDRLAKDARMLPTYGVVALQAAGRKYKRQTLAIGALKGSRLTQGATCLKLNSRQGHSSVDWTALKGQEQRCKGAQHLKGHPQVSWNGASPAPADEA